MIIRVSNIARHTFDHGPGIRMAIFFQGCLKHCKGCDKQDMWPMFGGTKTDTDEINKMIASTPFFEGDGVSLTGGEPFLQPAQALAIARFAKQRGLSVWCYSGYTFEEIREWNDARKELLKAIDVLVDGPFVEELKIDKSAITEYSDNLWLKSSNQRVIDVKKSLKKGEVVLYESKSEEGSTL